MPASRSRSPPRRRRDSEAIQRSGRDRGYGSLDGRDGRDERRHDRRRDDRSGRYRERDMTRRGHYDDRKASPPHGRSPGRNYHNSRDGRSNGPRSPRSASRHSKSCSPPVDKAQPNFNPSGLLAAETNTVARSDGTSTLLKYNEPPEARRPSQGWRLYVFKGKEQVGMCHV